jgi:hypothetical protein
MQTVKGQGRGILVRGRSTVNQDLVPGDWSLVLRLGCLIGEATGCT